MSGGPFLQHGRDYVATSEDYPQIRVPLEMTGEGLPKLLAWDIQQPPYAGYGILRFSGGRVSGKGGFEETELAAIIDIGAAKVMAIEPHRQGSRIATWTWDGDRLQVASVDGATDEYQLRPVNVAVVGPGGQPFGDGTPKPERRRYRPKTIFDLLFGN